jgi:hypothetical protein
MAVASGIGGQIVATSESVYGVAPSLSSARSYEFKSETLAMKKKTVQGEGLHAGGLYDRTRRRVLVNYDVAGNIVMDCPTRQLAFWIQYMVGSFGEANATPAEIGTTGIYKSIHQPGSTFGYSFCVQKGVPTADNGTVEPFTYVGNKLSDWELKVSKGGLAELTLGIDGRNELAGVGNSDPLNASVPTLATFGVPTSGQGENVFHFREATLFTGGTPTLTSGVVSLASEATATNVTDVSIKQTYKLDNERIFIGSNGFKAQQIENGFRQLTGSITMEWLSSEAMYEAFAADTTTSLELTFTGPTVSTSNYLLDIIIPNIKLDGEPPKINGPAVVTQTIPFTGLDDETTTPIQITYQSEDAAI